MSRPSSTLERDLIPRVKQVISVGNIKNFNCLTRLRLIKLLLLIFYFYSQYLEENVHKTYVDVEEMASTLMTRYPEYSRLKQTPFRILVETGEILLVSGKLKLN
jgi:hypothetical protein